MPIQTVPIPESDVAAPTSILSQEDAATMLPKQCKVVEKKKKKKDVVRKKTRREAENSSGEGSNQERASLDDQEVIQSLMKGSILLYIIEKMVGMEDAVRFDESFAAYLELGHYLFNHLKAIDLLQAEASKALQEVQAEVKRV
ncbi:hypothetical protein COCNU_scaffold004753G000020 [Cocos nucifera]|nr:hypothetical protein [Cocos nucifera]